MTYRLAVWWRPRAAPIPGMLAPPMGGPAASILLRTLPTADDRSRLLADLADLATTLRGDDFWLGDEHPFFFTLGDGRDPDEPDDAYGEEFPSELESLDQSGLPALLGWRPQGILMFCAMCNRDGDHQGLAELCIRYAEQLDGIIDYGGCLAIGPSAIGPSPSPPRRIDALEGLPGAFYTATYRAVSGYATCHYSDAAFLRAFLHHRRFRMVK